MLCLNLGADFTDYATTFIYVQIKHLPFDRNKKVCLQIRIQIKHVANDKGVRGRTKQHHCRHKSASNGPRDASALGKSSSKKIAAYHHHHHHHHHHSHHQHYHQHRNHHRQHNLQLQMVGCSPGRLNLTWALAGQGWTESCLVSIISCGRNLGLNGLLHQTTTPTCLHHQSFNIGTVIMMMIITTIIIIIDTQDSQVDSFDV